MTQELGFHQASVMEFGMPSAQRFWPSGHLSQVERELCKRLTNTGSHLV